MKRGRPRKEKPKASTERSRKSRERATTEAKRRAIVLRHASRKWLLDRWRGAHGPGELMNPYFEFDDPAELAGLDQCEMEEHAKWQQWLQRMLANLIASLPEWRPKKR
jgi:hypothetical protein